MTGRPLRLELLAGAVKKPLGFELRAIDSDTVPPDAIYADARGSGDDSGPHRKAPPDPRRWLRGMTGFTATGRLRALCRVATVAGHLELLERDPSQHNHAINAQMHKKDGRRRSRRAPVRFAGPVLGPLSLQIRKNVKSLIFIENLLSPFALHELFQVVDRPHLNFARIFDALLKEDLSLVVRQGCLPLPPNSAVVPFLLLVLYVKLITKTTGHSDASGLFAVLRKKVRKRIHILSIFLYLLLSSPSFTHSPLTRECDSLLALNCLYRWIYLLQRSRSGVCDSSTINGDT